MSQFGFIQRTSMRSLIRQLYKAISESDKFLKREDIRNAKKNNILLKRLVALLEKEIEENEKKSK